jgi:hypothetical protein
VGALTVEYSQCMTITSRLFPPVDALTGSGIYFRHQITSRDPEGPFMFPCCILLFFFFFFFCISYLRTHVKLKDTSEVIENLFGREMDRCLDVSADIFVFVAAVHDHILLYRVVILANSNQKDIN